MWNPVLLAYYRQQPEHVQELKANSQGREENAQGLKRWAGAITGATIRKKDSITSATKTVDMHECGKESSAPDDDTVQSMG